ncbi:MAG: tetratricopeptide repeat protein [Candidatus Binatia bacterium]
MKAGLLAGLASAGTVSLVAVFSVTVSCGPTSVHRTTSDSGPALPEVRIGELSRVSELLDERIDGLERESGGPGAGRHGSASLASLRFVARGRDLLEAGSPEAALDMFERSISVDGGDWQCWVYAAEAWRRLGQPAEGRIFLERAQGKTPVDRELDLELEVLRRAVYLVHGTETVN